MHFATYRCWGQAEAYTSFVLLSPTTSVTSWRIHECWFQRFKSVFLDGNPTPVFKVSSKGVLWWDGFVTFVGASKSNEIVRDLLEISYWYWCHVICVHWSRFVGFTLHTVLLTPRRLSQWPPMQQSRALGCTVMCHSPCVNLCTTAHDRSHCLKRACYTDSHCQFLQLRMQYRQGPPVDDADLVFCNTLHLMMRPGTEVVQAAGGLHGFTGRSKPLITDSGGFQVFSLAAGMGRTLPLV